MLDFRGVSPLGPCDVGSGGGRTSNGLPETVAAQGRNLHPAIAALPPSMAVGCAARSRRGSSGVSREYPSRCGRRPVDASGPRETRPENPTCPYLMRAAGAADHREEFRARAGVGTEVPEELARDYRHARLVHAARGHALVHAFHDDAHAARLEHALDAMRDLRGERLLHLEPSRERLDHARELADADDLAIRQVADV